jgi:hypothetical protein
MFFLKKIDKPTIHFKGLIVGLTMSYGFIKTFVFNTAPLVAAQIYVNLRL